MTMFFKGKEFKGKSEPKTHKLEVLPLNGDWRISAQGDEQYCKEFASMAMANGFIDYRITITNTNKE